MSETNYIERYWRDAKPEDAIKEPPMVARFHMYGDVPWTMGELHGTHTRGGRIWFDKRFCNSWTHCQVYDAPDPGEGWRLIDISKEEWQEGDEFRHDNNMWDRSLNGRSSGFSKDLFYRRRITPAVTYVPFTWEDREQLRGRWIRFKHPGSAEFLISKLYNSDKHGVMANDYSASSLLDEAIFLDTGKPVGKEVAQ